MLNILARTFMIATLTDRSEVGGDTSVRHRDGCAEVVRYRRWAGSRA
jgi:hypothetical protein